MSYSGWYLPEDERAKILGAIPAKYPDFVGHHITFELGSYDNLRMPDFVGAEIVGFADDGEGVQALVVSIDGSIERPMGGIFHITWSLDRSKGFKPVDSNRVIAAGWTKLVLPLSIIVEPRVFR